MVVFFWKFEVKWKTYEIRPPLKRNRWYINNYWDEQLEKHQFSDWIWVISRWMRYVQILDSESTNCWPARSKLCRLIYFSSISRAILGFEHSIGASIPTNQSKKLDTSVLFQLFLTYLNNLSYFFWPLTSHFRGLFWDN